MINASLDPAEGQNDYTRASLKLSVSHLPISVQVPLAPLGEWEVEADVEASGQGTARWSQPRAEEFRAALIVRLC